MTREEVLTEALEACRKHYDDRNLTEQARAGVWQCMTTLVELRRFHRERETPSILESARRVAQSIADKAAYRTIEPEMGEMIYDACKRLVASAPAEMTFNGTRLKADPGASADDMVRVYWSAR